MTAKTRFQAVGGEDGVRRIVDQFFARLEREPSAAEVRRMYPESLEVPAERLTAFLTSWWGGPLAYELRYGHPRLRLRHARFPIGGAARDAWLAAMSAALDACVDDAELRSDLLADFAVVAEHVRNR